MSMIRVVYAVRTMMDFFGRDGVRHLGNLTGATIFGMVYGRLRVERIKKIDSLRRRYSRAGLEEVLKGEGDEEAYNRKIAP
jgi:hypothetical protein